MSSSSEPARRLRPGVVSASIAVALFLTWEAMARMGFISPLLAPAPSRVVVSLIGEFRSGGIVPHLAATVYRVVAGILIGGSAGVVIGLAMGAYRRFRDVADPFVSAIYPLPKIAIFPVVMSLLGIGDASRIAVVSLAAFFPMLISTMNAVREISPTYLDVARNYGAGGSRLFTRVVLPASLPMILSGLRIALNSALHVTIAIEIAGATLGLGSLIWMSWEVLRIEVLYATLVVIMVLGISFNAVIRVMSAALVPWSVERRRTARGARSPRQIWQDRLLLGRSESAAGAP
ncbi:MAG: ABC transporter permease [Gemmatimonadaceae bacterium]